MAGALRWEAALDAEATDTAAISGLAGVPGLLAAGECADRPFSTETPS
jgi:hypothetical protein